MDADGVAAEVIFPDADAITGHGVAAVRRRPLGRDDRGPRARVRGRPRAQPLPRRPVRDEPERRGGVGLVPICHDVERVGRRDRVAGRQARHPRRHDPDDVARPHCRTTTRPTTRCGRRARRPSFPVHTHSGEAPREEMNDFIGIYLAEVVFWTAPPDRAPPVQRRVRALPGPEVRRDRRRAAYWVADMKWKWDQYLGGGHTTKKMAALMKGIISKLPSEYFGENIFVGASTMSKEEIRRRHVDRLRRRDVGHRLPAPRRHVAEHDGAAAQRLRRRAGRRHRASSSARPRRAATASTSTRCARSPSASARRPTISARTRRRGATPTRCAQRSGGSRSTASRPSRPVSGARRPRAPRRSPPTRWRSPGASGSCAGTPGSARRRPARP